MTLAEFKQLPPRERGYAVYKYGKQPGHPSAIDKKNPYQRGSQQRRDWYLGHVDAVREEIEQEAVTNDRQ